MKSSIAFYASFAAEFVHILHGAKCFARFVYYWFRFPTGWPVSGHDYEEQPDGRLVCRDCGAVSE